MPESLEDILQEFKIPDRPPGMPKTRLFRTLNWLNRYKHPLALATLGATASYEVFRYVNNDLNIYVAGPHSLLTWNSSHLMQWGREAGAGRSHDWILGVLKDSAVVLGVPLLVETCSQWVQQAAYSLRFLRRAPKWEKKLHEARFPPKGLKTWQSWKNLYCGGLTELTEGVVEARQFYRLALEQNPYIFQTHYAYATAEFDHYHKRKEAEPDKVPDNRDEMLRAAYGFFKFLGSYKQIPAFSPGISAWENDKRKIRRLQKLRGEGRMNTQERMDYNLGLSILNWCVGNRVEALRDLEAAVDFKSLFTWEQSDIRPFIKKVEIEGKEVELVDRAAYEQKKREVEENDVKHALFGAVGFNAIAVRSQMCRSVAKRAAQWAFGKVYDKAVADERYEKRYFGDSKGGVCVITGPAEHDLVFKEGELEKLMDEIMITLKMAEATRHYRNYLVPTPIGIMQRDGKDIYMMWRAKGRLLSNLIRAYTMGEYALADLEVDMSRTLDYLLLLQKKMRVKDRKRPDIHESVQNHLAGIGVEQRLVDHVISNMNPLLDHSHYSKKAFLKDLWAANVKIAGKGILMLDNESLGNRPIASDVVRLIEIIPGIPEGTRDYLIAHYASRRKIDPADFRLQYHHELIGLVLRTTGGAVSWSGNREIGDNLLVRSIDAIRSIRDEHPRQYSRYQTNYDALASSLRELREFTA
jgi:hypothetical protein